MFSRRHREFYLQGCNLVLDKMQGVNFRSLLKNGQGGISAPKQGHDGLNFLIIISRAMNRAAWSLGHHWEHVGSGAKAAVPRGSLLEYYGLGSSSCLPTLLGARQAQTDTQTGQGQHSNHTFLVVLEHRSSTAEQWSTKGRQEQTLQLLCGSAS